MRNARSKCLNLAKSINYPRKALVYGAAGTAGVVLGCAALPLIGFASPGVVVGSIAASMQSSIGSVAAGSTFATLQSLGATGTGNLLFGTVGGVAGVGAAKAIMWKFAGRVGRFGRFK